MKNKHKFILAGIIGLLIIIGLGFVFSYKEVPKTFTICQSNHCIDTDTISASTKITNCLDAEKTTFCGSFIIFQNK